MRSRKFKALLIKAVSITRWKTTWNFKLMGQLITDTIFNLSQNLPMIVLKFIVITVFRPSLFKLKQLRIRALLYRKSEKKHHNGLEAVLPIKQAIIKK